MLCCLTFSQASCILHHLLLRHNLLILKYLLSLTIYLRSSSHCLRSPLFILYLIVAPSGGSAVALPRGDCSRIRPDSTVHTTINKVIRILLLQRAAWSTIEKYSKPEGISTVCKDVHCWGEQVISKNSQHTKRSLGAPRVQRLSDTCYNPYHGWCVERRCNWHELKVPGFSDFSPSLPWILHRAQFWHKFNWTRDLGDSLWVCVSVCACVWVYSWDSPEMRHSCVVEQQPPIVCHVTKGDSLPLCTRLGWHPSQWAPACGKPTLQRASVAVYSHSLALLDSNCPTAIQHLRALRKFLAVANKDIFHHALNQVKPHCTMLSWHDAA
jgi:hypothetical protein